MSGLITLVVVIWIIFFLKGSKSGKNSASRGSYSSKDKADKGKYSKYGTHSAASHSSNTQTTDPIETFSGYNPEPGTLADQRYKREAAESSSSLSSVLGTDDCSERNHGVNALKHASNKEGVIVKGCSQTTSQLIAIMEDRENDWLANQLKEEARLKNMY